MTEEDKKEMNGLILEHVQEKTKDLEKKLPKWTWLWRIISLLALIASAYSLSGCTVSQMSVKDDGTSKTTTMSFNPDINSIIQARYVVPTVNVTK